MNPRPLSIYLGRNAAKIIGHEGWQGNRVSLLLGASGGPKWLILGQLDRLLFDHFLLEDRTRPLRALGSSVGSWRHACLAQKNSTEALDRFEEIYINWEYGDKPGAADVSAASLTMLAHILGDDGAGALVHHPLLHSYVVTARGKGLNSAKRGAGLAAGMGRAALANAAHRRLLATQFQRIVFASAGAPTLPFGDFSSAQVLLEKDTVAPALHASGSIPFVLAGERDIPGGPAGHYWDGGIIDYHFDLKPFAGEQIILYPHFRSDLTTGWFDKFLPWRREKPPVLDNLILVCPSEAFIASLPRRKIPDRSDFTRMSTPERLRYWRTCIARSSELAEDFQRQLDSADPLANTQLLGQP